MKFIIFEILIFALCIQLNAQTTPLVSQYMFSGSIYNPAYTGSKEALAASVIHKNQWIGIEGAPVTELLSIHAPLKKYRFALGVAFTHQSIGIFNKSRLLFNYAYRIPAGNGKMALGMSAGFINISANYHKIHLIEDNDRAFTGQASSYLYPNFGLGCYYYSDLFYWGFSIPSIGNAQSEKNGYNMTLNFSPVNYTYMFATGWKMFNKNDNFTLNPSILLKYNSNFRFQYDLTLFGIFHKKIWLGTTYRVRDNFVVLAKYHINNQLRIGYAYEMGIGQLSNANSGSHEIMLQYVFNYLVKAVNPRL